MSAEKPAWRWWLFCAASWACDQTRLHSWPNRVALKALGWSVLPEWLGWDAANDSDIAATCGEGAPF